MNARRVLILWILFGHAPLLVGCHKGTTVDRLPVHGTVTFPKGEKFQLSITFQPQKGQDGQSATAMVSEGKYEFTRQNGPSAGPKDVMLRRVGRAAPGPNADMKDWPRKSEWTRTAELSDDGTYEQNFELD